MALDGLGLRVALGLLFRLGLHGLYIYIYIYIYTHIYIYIHIIYM